MSSEGLRAAAGKMRAADEPEEAIRSFESAYRRLESGAATMLPTSELEPAGDVAEFERLPEAEDSEALSRAVLIKLNGGLATTMGLRSPKSLVEARDGRTFLDIIVGQTLALRRRHRIELPLALMDSQATRAETLEALARYPELNANLDPDFVQSMIPKLDAQTLMPVSWPDSPGLEWCPPGHGDVYGALRRSGMLSALLERGLRYAMVSNADNLGATLDPRIVQFVSERQIPFLMEVVEGSEADRKGGHIARRRADGQLVLRETAQTPDEDQESFRDYGHWRWYNTNSLWIDLQVLDATLERHQGVLELPLIVNQKTVDPRDARSPAVIQLESAMGAAIESFPGAELLWVPRTRFAPVKTTDDLLVLRSDAYRLTEEMIVEPVPERGARMLFVELDKRYYRLLDQFERRLPWGPPSLVEADRLVVHGDVTFGRGVKIRGAVEIDAADGPVELEDGLLLTG